MRYFSVGSLRSYLSLILLHTFMRIQEMSSLPSPARCIIGADTNPNDPKNMFATLQFTVNEALRKILPTNKENLCVIHPIGVFYGK